MVLKLKPGEREALFGPRPALNPAGGDLGFLCKLETRFDKTTDELTLTAADIGRLVWLACEYDHGRGRHDRRLRILSRNLASGHWSGM